MERDTTDNIRKIIHLDLDAFFCAVEEFYDPTLRGKPFAVGGSPDGRGVISSCSYASRKYGVRSAMPTIRALRLCPELRLIRPRHKIYSQMSSEVIDILHGLASLVEQISIDEAFLDVTDSDEPSEDIAKAIQAAIHVNTMLPCSLGVASNKLVAKIANNVGKLNSGGDEPPNAITFVQPGEEASFLSPLPAEALWGVGPKTAERLAELGILTIGDLASYSDLDLSRIFGKMGPVLSLRARGIDNRPVITFHEPKSFSRETTFASDVRDLDVLQNTIKKLSASVGKRLHKSNRYGSTVKLKLRWPDFTTITRQQTLPSPTNQEEKIYDVALSLFKKEWIEGRAVRLIGVGISGLSLIMKQLSLWDFASEPESKKSLQLQQALDEIRERFGDQIIQRGGYLQLFRGDERQSNDIEVQ